MLSCPKSTGDVPFESPEFPDGLIAKIRRDHPRLFFNQEMWPAVKERALGPAKDYFDEIKGRVDGYPEYPQGDSGGPPTSRDEKIGGQTYSMPEAAPATEWGVQAMETVLVFLVTRKRKYLDKAKRMLEVSVQVYHQCYRDRRVVNWYSTSRVCAIAAYDWLTNDLTPAERRDILLPLMQHVEDVQPEPGRPKIHGSNDSGHNTGFYGVRNLLWFAGLAAYADGLDDDRALKFLRLGYKHYRDVLNFRKDIAGDDGGLASATVGYAMGAYSWAEFNLYHTWHSATGEELAPLWPALACFPVWIDWNWIPAKDHPKEFGSGDTYHGTNDLRTYHLYEHMSQIVHFYGRSHPELAALAARIKARAPEQRFVVAYPIYPFLLTDADDSPPKPSLDSRVSARHFEGLGQVIMRSGTGPGDTYCLYTIGSRAPNHKHYDENNFIIYRKGFLALDSGTRGNSKDFHLQHYYAQTVAHNCVLIHLPDEPHAPYWGPKYEGPEGGRNYGGMNKTNGGKAAAFETNDLFTYVAGDATPCYSAEKCGLALRQFVFLAPDVFVVCDRVVSTRPEYGKTWLLHTQNEPVIESQQFRADEGEGRLFCKTLFPKDAAITKIGGPGKEFWANGMNWELNEAIRKQNEGRLQTTGKAMLLGNWRVEVSPAAPRTDDAFLHLVQVGDQALEQMARAELVEAEETLGIRLERAGLRVQVSFRTAGGAAGHIRIETAGRILVDRALSEAVQPQSAYSSVIPQ
jgi:heparin/heparan-sulfate lyase